MGVENETVDRKKTGLYDKYRVQRRDGRDAAGGDREGARYFVLDLDFDEFSPMALMVYASLCRREYPELANDVYRLAHEAELRFDEKRKEVGGGDT